MRGGMSPYWHLNPKHRRAVKTFGVAYYRQGRRRGKGFCFAGGIKGGILEMLGKQTPQDIFICRSLSWPRSGHPARPSTFQIFTGLCHLCAVNT